MVMTGVTLMIVPVPVLERLLSAALNFPARAMLKPTPFTSAVVVQEASPRSFRCVFLELSASRSLLLRVLSAALVLATAKVTMKFAPTSSLMSAVLRRTPSTMYCWWHSREGQAVRCHQVLCLS
ncbi:MAG: hypothetical protein J3R72DRAFT_257040 [Linnemannia gamsii]|nr:MAG: hypothetical protein J3R72DRAFT_257040 [Linnemannia gamsii]